MTKEEQTQLEHLLPEVCEALLQADPDIVAIVQFGSSVYAPELACDVDLFVVTEKRKSYGVYFYAIPDTPIWFDVVPKQVDEKAGWPVALGVRATGRLLYGDWEVVEKVVSDVPVPTFDEARRVLGAADNELSIAQAQSDAVVREAHYRNAFNGLFDSARLAVMCYLNTEQTRWGQLRRLLPSPFNDRFYDIISQLHVAIFYNRALPLVDIEAEYQKWRDEVLKFIKDLEAAAKP